MQITLYSNFMNHHQAELSEELYRLAKGNFRFVACQPIEEERIRLGYADMNRKYDFILRPYESDAQRQEALSLATESDVMIFGSGDGLYFRERMKNGGLTFRYLERPFKKGIYRRFIPTTRKKIYNGYTKYKDSNLYLLCSSAYTAYDLSLCGFPAEKCFKWGYFPKAFSYENIEKIIDEKTRNSLLWVGRFLAWKHPEAAVETAEYLREKGKHFHLTMVGDGEEMSCIRSMIAKKKLEDYVTLTGSMPAEKVRGFMEKAEVFLFTSDFFEGWGAVLNEGMNSGCACVASHAIGSVPYLIENEENGLLYKNGNSKALCRKVESLLDNAEKRKGIGKQAYQTILDTWNAKAAAKRLIALIENLPKVNVFENGPCSRAEILKNTWYKE